MIKEYRNIFILVFLLVLFMFSMPLIFSSGGNADTGGNASINASDYIIMGNINQTDFGGSVNNTHTNQTWIEQVGGSN